MPREYEAIRDRLIKSGLPVARAKGEAARIWNRRHPDDPNPWNREKKRRRRKKK